MKNASVVGFGPNLEDLESLLTFCFANRINVYNDYDFVSLHVKQVKMEEVYAKTTPTFVRKVSCKYFNGI